ncbi:hypothetical protein ZIOFF_069954 [Zingiber officinale]|uniref:Uncharacterized protein n=1 Tax=Zingiber officinale TaxID=94328 RepID=A0A8J5EQB0_ZINOF|nr:hypothetical protein ZIOFF_069954 [Zingiber officinale]
MADENGKQTETESRPWHQTVTLLLVSLRLAALVATSTAAGLIYFVLANAIASMYNLLAMLLRPCLKNIGRQVLVHLLQLRSGPLKLWAQGCRPVPPSSRVGLGLGKRQWWLLMAEG